MAPADCVRAGAKQVDRPRWPWFDHSPTVVSDIVLADDPRELGALLSQARRADRIALDVESNGLFAYRPGICTVQLAWNAGPNEVRVVVVDTLAIDPIELGGLLGSESPIKVLHDLAFDARMLHAADVELRAVRDTVVAASFLGHTSTGLATLMASELGVQLSKSMQASNWARRPLDPASLAYLAADVEHLLALHDLFWDKVVGLGIAEEVQTECDYRLWSAYHAEVSPMPAFWRVRGAAELDTLGKVVFKCLFDARERLAEQADVPVFRVASDQVLLELARHRPSSLRALRTLGGRVRGLREGVAKALAEAVRSGIEMGQLSEEDSARFDRPPHDREQACARKRSEKRLVQWRRQEAKRRGVPEQVVLPGHCVRSLAMNRFETVEEIGKVQGFGTARIELYGEQLVRLLMEDREG